MRRWNGWGDEGFNLAMPEQGQDFLASRIGSGRPLADATLDSVCAKVPETRLTRPADLESLIDTGPEARVRHARGQSLADWLAMRSGEFGVFPDGVAYPTTSEEVQTLLSWAAELHIHLIPY
ncbi:MAG TPA: FAD-binding oxidoreductase, partial [Marinobacter adhaerens]|nr:FAD-binding oxidoreductase [Marinobacter adhaerens]